MKRKFKVIDGELFCEYDLGKTTDFVKNMLNLVDDSTDVLTLCSELTYVVSNYALEHLNKDMQVKYFEMLNKYKRGYDIANKVMTTDKRRHYFIKDRHLGDSARTLPLINVFKNYHKKNNTFPIEKIVIITLQHIADLAQIYPAIDEIIVLNRQDISDLVYFLKNCNSNAYSFYLDDDIITNKMKEIYCLPKDISFANELLRLPSKLNDTSIINAREVMKEHNTEPSKTIVFLPYSYSSTSIPKEILEEVTVHFSQKGFTVFTNVGSDDEDTINGTLRLNVPPTTVLAMGQMGCLMIGAQSGMMDIMLWLKLNINCIIVFLMKSYNDIMFANYRNLTEHITYKETATYIMLNPNETDRLGNDIIEQSKLYYKRTYYVDVNAKLPDGLYQIPDLNNYINNIANMNHIIVFISVFDSANTYWNNFDSRQILGLKEDLSKKWRLSYVAVVDNDEKFCYETISDKWEGVSYQYFFSDLSDNNENVSSHASLSGNNCWLYSCGMDGQRYTRSCIWINGKDYSMSKRGLNIVVYSKELSCVIDSINVDTFGDDSLTVRRHTNFLDRTD